MKLKIDRYVRFLKQVFFVNNYAFILLDQVCLKQKYFLFYKLYYVCQCIFYEIK